ncbi:uncharacterized protein B0H18DRAFT_956993 [Fomitopsis serialis]|uniref:uncharacterized protein n=1 Tax=Fomitopsis serialis TaxID=139415 RepID=UPI00200826A3|nr:uncharacterized protein B0H18DRAFT_956993 [Neoantrodia serialis]KAH9920609.1 hypothetical protein B0H18DRAFT_956993 [Neoantrodia serialis]
MRTSTVVSLILTIAITTPALARPLGEGARTQVPAATNREGYVPHSHVAHHHTDGQAPHAHHPEGAHIHVAHDSYDARPHGTHPQAQHGTAEHRHPGLQAHEGFQKQGSAAHRQGTPPFTVPAETSRGAYHERRARGFDSDEELLARAIVDELVNRSGDQKAVTKEEDKRKPAEVKKEPNWKTSCKVGAKELCHGANNVRKDFFTWRIHVRNENPELFEREYDGNPVMVERGMELDELD